MKYYKNIQLLQYQDLIIFLFVFDCLSCSNLQAGEISSKDSTIKHKFTLLGSYEYGRVLPSNNFVKGNNLQHLPITSFSAVSIQIAKQTYGNQMWEQLYNYPRYGIGIYHASFLNTKELGAPIALCGMLEIPLIRWKNFSLNSDFGFGLTFNWESYSQDNYNIALGAKESAYIDGGFSLEYNLSPGLFFNIGTSFTHFSNGSLKNPNFGINLLGPKISVGYNFNNLKEPFKHQVIPKFQKQSECIISFFTGWKHSLYHGEDPAVDLETRKKGVYYNSYGLSAAFNRQVSYRSKFGFGMMVDYLGIAGSTITVADGKLIKNAASFRKGLELSIFPLYELVIDRFSFQIQEGYYLYRTKYPFPNPVIYQRVGIKYNFAKNLSLGIFMRTYNYNISDYIEWTIGYRFHL